METGHRIKYGRLHIEDYLREIPAEQVKETGVYAHEGVTESPGANTGSRIDNLPDTILRSDSPNAAYKKVKTNRDVDGIDGIQVDELLPYLREHQSELVEQIREGKYKPNPVRKVETPKKEKGKTRKLGISTVVGRIIQQAVTQELIPLYEGQFSDNSFESCPGRGMYDALERCRKYINEGCICVVSMGLQSCSDTVNHSKLVEVLPGTVKGGEGREGSLADTQVSESQGSGGRRVLRNGRGYAVGRTIQSLA